MRLAVVCLLALSCSSAPEGSADLQVSLDLSVTSPDLAICNDNQIGDGGIPPSFENVQRIFDSKCIGCHCCDAALSLASDVAYKNLVNQPVPMSESCGGTLVVPGNPAASYIFQKLTTAAPCSGKQMPLDEFGSSPLPACMPDLVRRWIASGALNN